MFGYAFLFALKLKYGFRVFLEGRHLEHLSYFYDNIDQVESLDDLCDEGKSFPWVNSTEIWTDLGEPGLKIGQCMDYYKNVSKQVILGKLIYLGDCSRVKDGAPVFATLHKVSFLPKNSRKLQNSGPINLIHSGCLDAYEVKVYIDIFKYQEK